jgi:tetratricopeptide (TPR) repeat protein
MCKIIEYPQKWFITAGASAVISYIIQNQVGFGVIPTSSLFWILVGIVIGAGANNMKYRYHTQRINILSRILLLVIGTIVSILLIRYSINACIADVYYKNALALTHDGELSQAIYMYEKALEYNPGEEFYYGEMLSVYSDMSDTSREALDMLIRRAKDAVKCNPYHAYYYNILSSAYGKAYVKYGDISARNKAIEACKKALKLKPLFGDPHNNLAAIYVHEHKYKEAMDEIKKALEIYSENAEYWRILGELQLNQGLTEQGIAALEQAVKYNPELVNTLIILGKYYFNRGKLSEAAKKFEQIVRLVPDNFQYHSDLGSIYFKLHRFDAAANEFAIALKLYPEHKYSLDMLALCKERMKTR